MYKDNCDRTATTVQYLKLQPGTEMTATSTPRNSN